MVLWTTFQNDTLMFIGIILDLLMKKLQSCFKLQYILLL